MHKDLQLNLESLKSFSDDVPGIGNFADRMLADNYEDFVSILYADIDKIVSRMEENPELYCKDSEDRLTIDIKNQLCAMGYDASHETKVGGHVDLIVKKTIKQWLWLGEAKIHKDYEWLLKGFNQLTTRYSSGSNGANQGGMLIYIRNTNANSVMNKWDEKLKGSFDNIVTTTCTKNNLSFYSTHDHQRSGLSFKVRHIPFVLHFSPQDK